MVRFVEYREGNRRGPVRDAYLGVHGSAGAIERYEQEIWKWVSQSLQVGWAPAGWQPAQTGHDGVLTVQGLVGGFKRYLESAWGEGWQLFEADPDQLREYKEALERARELRREGRPRKLDRKVRWMGDREMVRESKRLGLEARLRYGHLDVGLDRLWTAKVLSDLLGRFGRMASAVSGDRELRQLRAKWKADGCSLSDRKTGMEVVQDAYWHVIGRKPEAPWDLDRSVLEKEPQRYGLDFGTVGADGRWVRTN